MKGNDPMNWTKRETQFYGVFMAALGCIIGILGTKLVIGFIEFCN